MIFQKKLKNHGSSFKITGSGWLDQFTAFMKGTKMKRLFVVATMFALVIFSQNAEASCRGGSCSRVVNSSSACGSYSCQTKQKKAKKAWFKKRSCRSCG